MFYRVFTLASWILLVTSVTVTPVTGAKMHSRSRSRSRGTKIRKPGRTLYKYAVGFENLGNTCYMAASLQALLALPPVVQLIDRYGSRQLAPARSEVVDLADDDSGPTMAAFGPTPQLSALHTLLRNSRMQWEQRAPDRYGGQPSVTFELERLDLVNWNPSVDMDGVVYPRGKLRPEAARFMSGRQQCANDFTDSFLENGLFLFGVRAADLRAGDLRAADRAADFSYPFLHLFSFQTNDVMHLPAGVVPDYMTSRLRPAAGSEPMMTATSLKVRFPDGVAAATEFQLLDMLKTTVVNGESGRARQKLYSTPPVLRIEIARFESKAGSTRKLTNLVRYPLDFNIVTDVEGLVEERTAQVVAANLVAMRRAGDLDAGVAGPAIVRANTMLNGYHLHAIVEHHGENLTSGHYTARTRIDAASDAASPGASPTWYHFDDKTTTHQENLEQIREASVRSAVILYYVREDHLR